MPVGPDILAPWPVYLSSPLTRHSLNRGRLLWWLALPGLDGGQQWYDLCGLNSGQITGITSSSGWRDTTRPGGSRSVLAAGGSEMVLGACAKLPGEFNDPWTTAFWHRTTTYVPLANLFGFGSVLPATSGAGGDQRFLLSYNNNYFLWGWNADWDTLVPFDADGVWHHIALVSTGTGMALYRDGVVAASRTSIPYWNPAYPNAIAFSRHSAGASSTFGSIDDCGLWNRALSADEIAEYYRISQIGYPGLLNRYQPDVVTLVAAAPPPTGYTLTGLSASEAESGSAAGLVAARSLVGTAAAEAETASSASLITGPVLATGSGAESEAGSSVGLNATFVLVAAAAAESESASSANLITGPVLAAGSGAESEIGSSAGLRVGRQVVAAAGVEGETSALAILSPSRLVLAAAAAEAEDGSSATLTVTTAGAFLLTATSRAEAELGSAAVLRATHSFQVTTASEIETGSAVLLKLGWLLRAQAGPEIDTPAAVGLRRTIFLAGTSSSELETPVSVTLRLRRGLLVGATSDLEAGSVVTLTVGMVGPPPGPPELLTILPGSVLFGPELFGGPLVRARVARRKLPTHFQVTVTSRSGPLDPAATLVSSL